MGDSRRQSKSLSTFRNACGPVLFQFVPGALHIDIPLGCKFRTDPITHRCTSLDGLAEPSLTSSLQLRADQAIHVYLLRPSARPAVDGFMMLQEGTPKHWADYCGSLGAVSALAEIPVE